MRVEGKSLTWILLAALLSVVGGTWALYKPIRILAPELNGLVCLSDRICIDDPSRYEGAKALYDEAVAFVGQSVGSIERHPRVVFCTTETCYLSFGLEKPAAHTTPFGIIVSPRGWLPHYVRHELIHHVQQEQLGYWKLGPVRQWRSPEWFIEGMAYALSDDPRAVLMEPNQSFRSRFQAWYREVGADELWEAGRAL